jgi:hypothetical protein
MGQLVALLAQLSPGGRRMAEAELWPVLARDFDMLNALNWLVLRHKDARPVEIVEKTYQG